MLSFLYFEVYQGWVRHYTKFFKVFFKSRKTFCHLKTSKHFSSKIRHFLSYFFTTRFIYMSYYTVRFCKLRWNQILLNGISHSFFLQQPSCLIYFLGETPIRFISRVFTILDLQFCCSYLKLKNWLNIANLRQSFNKLQLNFYWVLL